jgi:LysR family transcriptional regulator, nod-box dependent transcriptional activator
MRFQRLDLNLLVALDALLTERSVSLAAERICLSQSATSSALGRLREYFGDELLVVKGRNMVLTARAETLVAPVRAVLEQVRSTIAVSPPFDPASSDRTITLMASDYMTEVLLTTALRDMHEVAPLMRFEILPINEGVESLERGSLDILLTIDYALSQDHPSQVLFEDDYVVVGWKDSIVMKAEMTRDRYFELGHVTARFGRARVPAFDDWFMRRQSQQRRIEVVAPSFLSVASLVIGTDRITTMHRRLARKVAKQLPVVIKPVPFEIPPIREAAQWHIANNNDPAIRWVVERLAAVAAEQSALANGEKVVALDSVRSAYSHDEIAQQFRAITNPSKSA